MNRNNTDNLCRSGCTTRDIGNTNGCISVAEKPQAVIVALIYQRKQTAYKPLRWPIDAGLIVAARVTEETDGGRECLDRRNVGYL